MCGVLRNRQASRYGDCTPDAGRAKSGHSKRFAMLVNPGSHLLTGRSPAAARAIGRDIEIFFALGRRTDVSGVETLSHPETGSFTVPREWTDWGPPGTSNEPNTNQRPL